MSAESKPLSTDEKAMMEAACKGELAKLRELLGKGVSPNVRDSETHALGMEWNITPLMCAAANGHVEIVRALLEAGAEIHAASDAHKEDGGSGSQALHHAMANNHLAAAQALLDGGADPNAVGRCGRTPLTAAIYGMSVDGVKLLLQRGADPKLKVRRKDYDPLLYAAVEAISKTSSLKMHMGKLVSEASIVWERKPQIIELFRILLDAGADPNAMGPLNSSPLKRLAQVREMPDELRLPLVGALLKTGAKPDLADKHGNSALTVANLYKQKRVVELLQSAAASGELEANAARASASAPASLKPDKRPKGQKQSRPR